jgi:hypothetical protein
MEIGSPRIYLVGRIRSRSRTTLREAEGQLMEANEERQKLFSAKSAPINHGRTMEDPTARNNWSDVDMCSLEEPYGYSRS